jgi:hypothetical protein
VYGFCCRCARCALPYDDTLVAKCARCSAGEVPTTEAPAAAAAAPGRKVGKKGARAKQRESGAPVVSGVVAGSGRVCFGAAEPGGIATGFCLDCGAASAADALGLPPLDSAHWQADVDAILGAADLSLPAKVARLLGHARLAAEDVRLFRGINAALGLVAERLQSDAGNGGPVGAALAEMEALSDAYGALASALAFAATRVPFTTPEEMGITIEM